MRYRHILPVDGVANPPLNQIWRMMGDDLMAIEIEIDPFFGTAAFGAAKKATVKLSSGGKIIDWKCEMKGWHAHLRAHVIAGGPKQSSRLWIA